MGIAAPTASRLRKLFGASGMKVRAQLPDWLPVGLKSVVRVTGVAPARTGTFYFEPTLFQSGKAFRSNGLSVGIRIR